MSRTNCAVECWIWTELLAFDRDLPDCGVGQYLRDVNMPVDGISLLLGSPDFILLHGDSGVEDPLFPDVASRFGHESNGIRYRQPWTGCDLMRLIGVLHQNRIKVLVQVFAAGSHNRFHREFLAMHPETAVVYYGQGPTAAEDMLSRLNDGRYLEDIFAEKLAAVLKTYDFDGWHGADWFGPGGSLGGNCSDNLFRQFAEWRGHCEWAPNCDHDIQLLTERVNRVWHHCFNEWNNFITERWTRFWDKMIDVVHRHGGVTMMNSGNTRGVFESRCHLGFDYPTVAAAGVDYLVVETVGNNFGLIKGCDDYRNAYRAALAEYAAVLPDATKLLFLHCVRDVIEAYDVMKHAPAALEAEFHELTSLRRRDSSGTLRRSAAGFLVCLGDAIKTEEWRQIKRWRQRSEALAVTAAGEWRWLCSAEAGNAWRDLWRETGRVPAYRQIAALTANGVDIAETTTEFQAAMPELPTVIPDFDLLPESIRNAILADGRQPLLLLGEEKLPGHLVAAVRVSPARTFGASLWNPVLPMASPLSMFSAADGFRSDENYQGTSIFNRIPSIDIPQDFYVCVAEEMNRQSLAFRQLRMLPRGRCEDAKDKLRTELLQTEDGIAVAIYSSSKTYTTASLRLTPPCNHVILAGEFPMAVLKSDETGIIRTTEPLTPFHIAPEGVAIVLASLNPVPQEDRSPQ